MRSFIIICTVFAIVSCNESTKFERSKELFSYLEEVQHFTLDNQKQYLFILSNKSCNCSGDPMELIPKYFKQNKLPKIVIIEKKDSTFYNTLTKLNNTKVYFDSLPSLYEYGLSNATNYLFEIKDKKIVYWNYLSNKTDSVLSLRYLKE